MTHAAKFGIAAVLALVTPHSGFAQATGSSTAPTADGPAKPTQPAADQRFAFHAQATFVVQGNAAFAARFSGPNSLRARGETRETADLTLYVGARPWRGAEIWVNPEIDQGFGLANTLGLAGFSSGEAYKVGKATPYVRMQRLFFRQTLSLGGARTLVESDLNQLGGSQLADRLVLTVGKFSVGDVFDTNRYAHDPRADFFNWTVIEAGSFDYAADAWGYSSGGTAELYHGSVALRAGLFNLSDVPNSEHLGNGFRQYEALAEVEERHRIGGREGKLKLTGFLNHGNMARLDDAVAYARANGGLPDPVPVRRFASRLGASVNFEQSLTDALGLFARAGFADGRYEAYEFTDVDRSASIGLSLKGAGWHRADDRLGVALVVNQASRARLRYLAAGGLGILIGDGALPHPGEEIIGEAYYDLAAHKGAHVSTDVQLIGNPAYNRDRGPVAVFAARLHGQY